MEISANAPEFRRVRTAEGAAYYGLPIGSLIKPGAAKAIVKKDSWNSKTPVSPTVALNEYLGKVGEDGDVGPAPLKGPALFEVDGESYSAPKGSRLFSNADGSVKYVITPDGHVTPFTKDAQVALAPALGKSLHAQLTKPGGNEKYKEEQFGKSGLVQPKSGDTSATDAPVGTTVVSRNGDFSLTKTETGWEYPAFGIEVDNETVQGLMDKGDLSTPTPEAAPEEPVAPEPNDGQIVPVEEPAAEPSVDEQAAASDDAMFGDPGADPDFTPSPAMDWDSPAPETAAVPSMEEILAVPGPSLADMPQMQFLAALDAYPEGKVLFAPNENMPEGAVQYTKGLDEKWHTQTGGTYSAGMMWYVHSALTEENPAPEYSGTPEAAPEDPTLGKQLHSTLADVAPKMASKIKFKETSAPKGASEPFNTDKNAPLADIKTQAAADLADSANALMDKITAKEEAKASAPEVTKESVQVIPEGKMIAHADVVAAIEGLEGHSGFQVAYGLKGLPDSNPFKDPGLQNQIKDYASEAFPDLKPKPAFVAYLKQKAGIATPAEEQKASGPKNITIGSATPKNVGVQGYDGGQFSEQDITEAIAILEDFQGKAFKAALNKKGNALGTLDPTKIVGFDKDKTVMKDKFLALLKTKVSTPSTVDPDALNTAIDNATDPHAAPSLTQKEIAALPIGTVGSFDDGTHIGTWKKTAENEWTMTATSNSGAQSSVGNKVSDFAISGWTEEGDPYTISAPSSEPAQVPQKPTLEHLEKAGHGSSMTLTWNGVGHDFWKNGDYWDDGSSKLHDKAFKILMDSEGTFVSDITIFPKNVEPVAVPDVPTAPIMGTVNPSLLDVIAAPQWKAVLQVTDGDDNVEFYVKNDKNEWIQALDAGGEPIDAGHYGGPSNANMHLITKAPGSSAYLAVVNPEASKPEYAQAPAATQKVAPTANIPVVGTFTAKDVQTTPVGTFVAVFDSSGGGQSHRLEKTGGNEWTFIESTDPDQEIGETLTSFEMEAYAEHQAVSISFDAPNSTFVSGYQAAQDKAKVQTGGPLAQEGKDAASYQVAHVGLGSVLNMHTKYVNDEGQTEVTDYTFVKTGPSKWEISDTNSFISESGDEWPDTKIEDALDKGAEATWDVVHEAESPAPEKPAAEKTLTEHLATKDQNAIVKVVGPDGKNASLGLPSTAGTWLVNKEHGSPVEVMTGPQFAKWLETQPNWAAFYDGEWHYSDKNDEQAAPVVANPSGLEPGKYASNGKAYMIVKADGKGVYVDSKGTVTALTVAKVKSNHAAGMNNYQGVPDTIPAITPVKDKKPVSVDKIPDGTYFSGDPNDVKTPVYTVADGKVTITKPKTSTEGSTSKVGSKVTSYWMDAASVGASLQYQNKIYVKTDTALEASSWVGKADGVAMTDYQYNSNHSPYYSYGKIMSHGAQEPVEIPLAKAKTLFATGKFVDLNGNSVVPEGYSGAVMFFGGQTTMPALIKAKAILEADPTKFTMTELNQLATLGVKINQPLLKKKTLADNGGAPETNGQGVAYNKILTDQINLFTDGIEIEEPQGDAADYFTFNGQGEAAFPADLATMSTYSKPEKNAWIKAASLSIGDGKIIGLNPVKLSPSEADSWITAFRSGNFAQIYFLDVNAATRPGAKPMLEGYKHPGSPENEDTHKVAWQPAVEGEISALKDVPGNWTSLNIQASLAEIDNYLISAQMQNPTFLTNSEKRAWVQRHRQSNKPGVDALSVLAKQRADAGQTPLSDPIAWTDDLKPAKSYDNLFDDTEHPVGVWYGQTALDYYNDHKDENPDLVKAWDAETSYAYNETYKAQTVLEGYFAAEKEKAYQKSLIPVYTKKPIQTVKQGTHPISQWTDQWGNEYFFKPRPKGMEFRADIEALGNSLGRFWGYDSATPQIKTGDDSLDGAHYGLLMKGVPAVGDLMGVDFGTLSSKQIGDIAGEHVLDWMLDNDDTKGDNALITPDGKIVGIDKGRTFVSYGHWDGLNPDGMNTNANVVYGNMLKAVAAGKISKETADAAYLLMQKRIKRIQKSDSEAMAAMVTDAMKHRDKGYKVPYKIDGKLVSQDLNGLLAAIEDRKSKLDTDFAALWADTYKKAGYGDLPEIPLKAVDGIISGFDDPDLGVEILRAKSHSKSTMVGGSHVHGGDIQIWTDKTPDGQMNVEGRMFLSFRAQDQMIATLKGMSTPEAQTESGAFPAHLDIYWQPFFTAAKTVNHHSADGQYNMTSIGAWEEKEKALNADLLAWSPDLKTSNINGVETVAFPSGTSVPKNQMGQYKMMLDHYAAQSASIRKGYEEKAKIIPHIEQYKSVTIQPNDFYQSETGHAVLLGDGKNWLVTDFSGGNVGTYATDSDEVKAIKAGENGWAKVTKDKPDTKGFSVVLKNQTHENPASIGDDGIKSIKSETQHAGTGAKGSEYEITLPTGEKIYYRNYGQTNTVRSQSGMLSFRAKGSGASEAEMATSFERVQAALETLGISTAAAEEDDAQNVYWREMYDLFMHRNNNGATSAHTGFKADVVKKRNEITKDGADWKYFLEDLSASFSSAAEESAWWREVYSKHFGKDVIDKVVNERSYLPKFDHFNMDDHELETGHPYWIRFDMTLDSIRATGKILGSTSSKEPTYKVKSGGNLGAEERFRLTGQWADGMSATSDQQYGSAHNVYTRVQSMNGGSYSGYRTFYDPAAMLRTRTYSFAGDNFGRLDNRTSEAPMDPTHALKNFTGGSNETMLPHGASLLDTIEMYVFEQASARQEAIDFLKKRGIEMIRGLPVEDRLVMRTNIAASMAKVKASWTK